MVPGVGARRHETSVLLFAHVSGASTGCVDGAHNTSGFVVDDSEPAALFRVTHHHESPVLRIAGRGRADRSVWNFGEQIFGDLVGFELSRRGGHS